MARSPFILGTEAIEFIYSEAPFFFELDFMAFLPSNNYSEAAN